MLEVYQQCVKMCQQSVNIVNIVNIVKKCVYIVSTVCQHCIYCVKFFFNTILISRIFQVFNLLSADLLSIEKIIKGRQETYTLLSFFRDISPWSKIIQSLGKFHQSAVTNQVSNAYVY